MFDNLRAWWKRLIGEPEPPPPPKKRPLTGTDLNDPQSGEREISIDADLKRREKSQRGF